MHGILEHTDTIHISITLSHSSVFYPSVAPYTRLIIPLFRCLRFFPKASPLFPLTFQSRSHRVFPRATHRFFNHHPPCLHFSLAHFAFANSFWRFWASQIYFVFL
jgi:hypothetical protein